MGISTNLFNKKKKAKVPFFLLKFSPFGTLKIGQKGKHNRWPSKKTLGKQFFSTKKHDKNIKTLDITWVREETIWSLGTVRALASWECVKSPKRVIVVEAGRETEAEGLNCGLR